jgi:putative transposase
VRSLNQIIAWRGKPTMIRVDYGPEYVSGKLIEWACKHHITLSYIQPGKPQQNAYIERYNRTVRPSQRCHASPAGQWTNGSELISFTAFKRCKITPQNGYGLTTTPLMVCRQTTAGQRTAPTWASAASLGASPVRGGNDPLDCFYIALTPP